LIGFELIDIFLERTLNQSQICWSQILFGAIVSNYLLKCIVVSIIEKQDGMVIYNTRSKVFRTIPFIILCIIVLNTWFVFLSTEYVANWRHYLLLALLIANCFLYFTRFRPAIFYTGIILFLCTFFVLPPFKELESSFIFIGPVPIPWIEYWSFLILILYFCLNFNLLIGFYLDWKETKVRK
jgi:hypothetical protein